MVSEFRCDGAAMKTVLEKLQAIEESMNTAYTAAAAVRTEIDSKTAWTGASQKTMAAFLDLLLQYHQDFIQGGAAPLPKGITWYYVKKKYKLNREIFKQLISND